MTRDEAHAALQEVADGMAAAHPVQETRLVQLRGAIATARMAIDHLFDHAEKTAAEAAQGG